MYFVAPGEKINDFEYDGFLFTFKMSITKISLFLHYYSTCKGRQRDKVQKNKEKENRFTSNTLNIPFIKMKEIS